MEKEAIKEESIYLIDGGFDFAEQLPEREFQYFAQELILKYQKNMKKR